MKVVPLTAQTVVMRVVNVNLSVGHTHDEAV